MSNDTQKAIHKVERDGMVAVVVSPGFGAGWSTWASDSEAAAFDPRVVAWVEAGKPDVEETEAFGSGEYRYFGGLPDVVVEWVPKGARFVIEEYDGSESLRLLSPDDGYVA